MGAVRGKKLVPEPSPAPSDSLNVLKPERVDTARTKHHENVKEGCNDCSRRSSTSCKPNRISAGCSGRDKKRDRSQSLHAWIRTRPRLPLRSTYRPPKCWRDLQVPCPSWPKCCEPSLNSGSLSNETCFADEWPCHR